MSQIESSPQDLPKTDEKQPNQPHTNSEKCDICGKQIDYIITGSTTHLINIDKPVHICNTEGEIRIHIQNN